MYIEPDLETSKSSNDYTLAESEAALLLFAPHRNHLGILFHVYLPIDEYMHVFMNMNMNMSVNKSKYIFRVHAHYDNIPDIFHASQKLLFPLT